MPILVHTFDMGKWMWGGLLNGQMEVRDMDICIWSGQWTKVYPPPKTRPLSFSRFASSPENGTKRHRTKKRGEKMALSDLLSPILYEAHGTYSPPSPHKYQNNAMSNPTQRPFYATEQNIQSKRDICPFSVTHSGTRVDVVKLFCVWHQGIYCRINDCADY